MGFWTGFIIGIGLAPVTILVLLFIKGISVSVGFTDRLNNIEKQIEALSKATARYEGNRNAGRSSGT